VPDSIIIYAKKDHIASITLNRPGDGNAVNWQLAQEMADVCGQIEADDDIRVVILTGSGGVFCRGSETLEAGARCGVAAVVAGIDRPVIVAVNGDALGQGLELALAGDIRLAREGARFALPQVTAGAIPYDGGTQRLPRLIGRGKALELILTGEAIDAAEAQRLGLVSRVVSADSLAAEAESLAGTLAAGAPVALRYIKEAVAKGLDLTLEQGLRLEADLYFLIHTTADRTEGINAFLQKRTPGFKGE
jgi:enoyl-CoA hydratase/carnithine racemase